MFLISHTSILGWFKWGTGNTLWASIWCKGIPNFGNLSTSLLHHISCFLHHHIYHLVLHRTHPSVASSISWHCKNSCTLHEVHGPRLICILPLAKRLEVSSDTICCYTIGFTISPSIVGSYWNRICFGSWDRSGF